MTTITRRYKVSWLAAVLSLTLLVSACAPAPSPTSTATLPPSAGAAAPSATPTPIATPTRTPLATVATPAATPAHPPIVAQEQPARGGIVRFVSSDDASTLDIHRSTFQILYEGFGNAYNGILRYDPIQVDKVVPDLAERWEVSPDGRTYTFFFRRDIKWHDGVPFTAADAKMSVERMLEFAPKKGNIATVQKVEAPDDFTLKVTLSRPTPSFIKGIALGVMAIGPKHIFDKKGNLEDNLIGTGPFTIASYNRGESLNLVRNRDYFKKGLPYLDGAQWLIIPDFSTRVAAFKAGRVDVFGANVTLLPSQAEAIRRDVPDAQVLPKESLEASFLVFNVNRKPWDDTRVRKAAFLAISRQDSIKTLDEGAGRVGLETFLAEFAFPEEELLKVPGIRLDKQRDRQDARKLLEEAGFPKGFKSTITVIGGHRFLEPLAIFLKDQMTTVGIELALDPLDVPTFIKRRADRQFDTMALFGTIDFLDPDAALKTLNPKGQFNTLNDEKLMALFDQQSVITDPVKRREIIFELQRRSLEVVPHVMVNWVIRRQMAAARVRNFVPGIGNFSQLGAVEQVWLAPR